MKKKGKKSKKEYQLLILAMLAVVLCLPVSSWAAMQITSFKDMVYPGQWSDSAIPSYVFTGDNNGMTSIVGMSSQPLLKWMNDKGTITISAVKFGGGVQTYAVSGVQLTGAVAFSPVQFHDGLVTPWVTYTKANKAVGFGINIVPSGVMRETADGALKVLDWLGLKKFLGGG